MGRNPTSEEIVVELLTILPSALGNMAADAKANAGVDLPRSNFVRIVENPLSIDPSKQGIWLDRIRQEIQKIGGSTWGSSGLNFRGLDLEWVSVWGSNSSQLHSGLCTAKYKKRFCAFLLVEPGCSEERVSQWRSAVAAASDYIGSSGTEYSWWAVLGPNRNNRGIDRAVSGMALLDNISITAADVAYADVCAPLANLLFHFTDSIPWVPLVVEGRSLAHDWQTASESAYRELFKICALISVETERRWAVRATPQQTPINLSQSH